MTSQLMSMTPSTANHRRVARMMLRIVVLADKAAGSSTLVTFLPVTNAMLTRVPSDEGVEPDIA
jgi:hypothetical protein